jgi:hypothetical protein
MPLFQPKRVRAQSDDRSNSSAELYSVLEQGGTDDEPEGVAIASLTRGTSLEVQTRNTRYVLTLVDEDGHALIRGGAFFPKPTPVHIEGATVGGNVKLGWIGIGLSLELSLGGRIITTSPVQSVAPIAA